MIETRRLTVEGITTSVLVGGSGRPGEAVVFVHGNPDSGSDWMPLMTRVAPFATVVALMGGAAVFTATAAAMAAPARGRRIPRPAWLKSTADV